MRNSRGAFERIPILPKLVSSLRLQPETTAAISCFHARCVPCDREKRDKKQERNTHRDKMNSSKNHRKRRISCGRGS